MKRSLASGMLILAVSVLQPGRALAEVTIGPGVRPVIDVFTTDHYHLLNGTQITSPSLNGPPATQMLVGEAVNFFGGGSVGIDGGQYRGGNATFTGPSGTFTTVNAGHALRISNFTAEIYGGNFDGADAFSTSAIGSAAGGVGLVATLSTVTIYGGSFNGGTLTQPNVPPNPSNFPAVADIVLRASTGYLHGGDASYIVLANDSTLHVYGTNFQQTSSTLHGKFADGQPINLLIFNNGQVILHDLVPEPPALALLSIAARAAPPAETTGETKAVRTHSLNSF